MPMDQHMPCHVETIFTLSLMLHFVRSLNPSNVEQALRKNICVFKNSRNDPFNVAEIIQSLSRQQFETMWSSLCDMCTGIVEGFDLEQDDTGSPQAEVHICTIDIVQHGSNMKYQIIGYETFKGEYWMETSKPLISQNISLDQSLMLYKCR